jgi:cell division protein FtsB
MPFHFALEYLKNNVNGKINSDIEMLRSYYQELSKERTRLSLKIQGLKEGSSEYIKIGNQNTAVYKEMQKVRTEINKLKNSTI